MRGSADLLPSNIGENLKKTKWFKDSGNGPKDKQHTKKHVFKNIYKNLVRKVRVYGI